MCKDENKTIRNNTNALPNATGKSGEVVIVLDENVWKGNLGQTIWSFLGESYPMIPQTETMFDVVQIPPAAFSRIFRTHRNLVFFEVDQSIEKPTMQVHNDRWAYPQTIVTFKAKSFEEITRFIGQRGDKLVEVLEGADRERIVDNYSKHANRTLYDYLIENYQLKLIIPSIYKLDIEEKDFLWIAHETSHIMQGILIYHFPYTNENQFELENLIEERNKFVKNTFRGLQKDLI